MRTKILSVLIIAFIVALFARVFVVEGFFVQGDSMAPALQDGDYVFIYKLAYSGEEPERGDVIVAYPRQYNTKVVKRVTVLPGEYYEPVPGKKDKLDPEEYFIVGDNLPVSLDSRVFGAVDRWDIKGKVFGAFRLKTFRYIRF